MVMPTNLKPLFLYLWYSLFKIGSSSIHGGHQAAANVTTSRPCIDELPILNKLYHRNKNKGFRLVGITNDIEGPGAMQPIVDKLKIDFPIYWYGEKGVQKFKLNAIPMLFFIKDGEIVEKLYGRRPEGQLNNKFKEFLK